MLLDWSGAMGDVINLNRFRKHKARKDKAQRAVANRTKHGRTKADGETKQHELETRRHDGNKLEDDS